MRPTRPYRVKVQLSDAELRDLEALSRYERASLAETFRRALRDRVVRLVEEGPKTDAA